MQNICKETLEHMRKIDINSLVAEDLIDLEQISIDQTLPVSERIAAYINAVKNPYCFRVGDIIVKIKFSDTEETLAQKLEYCFNRL